MALISVLMGVYNEKSREQVVQAIDSVLCQTITDIEYIICDDGSDEDFSMWLREYCKKDKRILFLRNERNKGLAATLNICMEYATGTYIARMDADDIAKERRFEKQLEFLQSHPQITFVGCNLNMINNDGVWGHRDLPETPGKKDFLSTSPFSHPTLMIYREVLNEIGGYEISPFATRTEDYELFMRLYANGYLGYNIQERLYDYREDNAAYKKRRYRYRINESYVRYRGFKMLGILKGNYRYVVKPLIVGLIPGFVMRKIRERKFGKRG